MDAFPLCFQAHLDMALSACTTIIPMGGKWGMQSPAKLCPHSSDPVPVSQKDSAPALSLLPF